MSNIIKYTVLFIGYLSSVLFPILYLSSSVVSPQFQKISLAVITLCILGVYIIGLRELLPSPIRELRKRFHNDLRFPSKIMIILLSIVLVGLTNAALFAVVTSSDAVLIFSIWNPFLESLLAILIIGSLIIQVFIWVPSMKFR